MAKWFHRDAKDEPKLTGWKRVFKEVREWVVSLLVALVVVFVIKSFIFMPIRVDGLSMHPTLNDKERLAVTVYDVKIYNGIERGDVVICHYPERTNKDAILGLFTVKTNFVKRVVGLPGDTVSRVKGVTYINGTALDPQAENSGSCVYKDGKAYINGVEKQLTAQQMRRYEFDYEYVLGAKEYFVVGDNRYNSHDSRKWNGPEIERVYENNVSGDVGPITYDMIVGHARSVIWPLGEMRGVPADAEYRFPSDIQ